MKILVTGATGFVGREIVRQLHAEGRHLRLLVRDPESESVHEAVSSYGAEIHVGNVLDPASLEGAVRGMHAVIHLIGIIREFRESIFASVHTTGTENLIAAAQQAGVGRFIHMSALGTRQDAVSRYHQSKWAAEEVVRQSDIDYTIFRPSLIYGPDDQFVNLFAKLTRFSPVIPILASDSAHFQPLPLETVASAFVRSMADPRSIGQTFDLCGPDALTLAQIVDEICRVLGRRRLKLQMPLAISRRLAAFLEYIYPRVFRRPPPLNRDQLLMLQEDNVGNPEPANRSLNLAPASFRAGITKLLGH
jgi:NADH dehydrogenase